MRLPWLVLLPTILAFAIEKRDDFLDQMRAVTAKDMGGRNGDQPAKYFRELLAFPVLLFHFNEQLLTELSFADESMYVSILNNRQERGY